MHFFQWLAVEETSHLSMFQMPLGIFSEGTWVFPWRVGVGIVGAVEQLDGEARLVLIMLLGDA